MKMLAWERAFFTTTKVAPQRRVQRTRARSALMEAGWEFGAGELIGVDAGARLRVGVRLARALSGCNVDVVMRTSWLDDGKLGRAILRQ